MFNLTGDIAQGRSHWSLDDPTEEPLDDPTAPVDPAAFTRLWRQNHVSGKGPSQ